jgi:hypothetical protein
MGRTKKPIKETVTSTHKLEITGTFDFKNMTIQPEDSPEVKLSEFKKIAKFDGEVITIMYEKKENEEVE